MSRSWIAAPLALGLLAGSLPAQETAGLPQGLTPEERAYIQEHRAEYLGRARDQRGTKPEDVMPAPGEFEPVQAIAYAWSQFTSTLTELVKETVETARAVVIVESSWGERSARRKLEAAGVDMGRVDFVHTDFDAVWIRDYGPNFVNTLDGDREIVDLVYNRPRPNDDKVPWALGPALDVPVHKADLILPGGNIIFDGVGGVILSDMVFDEYHGSDPDLTLEELKQYMADYLGVHQVIVLEQMKQDGTGHADMFCKLLNENTVIVGEYATPGDGAANNYEILNRNAELLANSVNGAGEPFRVFRIPMPPYRSGISYTHTNSILVNGKAIVPVYGQDTDEAALEVYRTLLPGYEVVGVDSNGPIGSNGSLHCISHELNADPFELEVAAPAQAVAGEPIALEVTARAHRPVVPGSVQVFWRLAGEGEFHAVVATAADEVAGRYLVELPAQVAGAALEYYARAEDNRGMYETSPEDASASTVHELPVAGPAL